MNSSRIRVAARAALLLTCATLLAGCPCLRPGAVIIPDAALDAAIRAQLRAPFGCLTEADLLMLTELQASGLGIRSIEGLQFCRNLITVDLSNNEVVSISPLASLTNITYLDLSGNLVTNIEPLTGLFFLHTLLLDNNAIIRDWSPLEANVANGGFPEGGTVVVDAASAEDPDGNLLPSFRRASDALIAAGVDVLIAGS